METSAVAIKAARTATGMAAAARTATGMAAAAARTAITATTTGTAVITAAAVTAVGLWNGGGGYASTVIFLLKKEAGRDQE